MTKTISRNSITKISTSILLGTIILSMTLLTGFHQTYADSGASNGLCINLSTGIDANGVGTPFGTQEIHWTVTDPSVTGVNTFSTFLSAWYPITGGPDARIGPGNQANWISPYVTSGGSASSSALAGNFIYTITFSISSPGFLNLEYAADNAVELFLDGPSIGTHPGVGGDPNIAFRSLASINNLPVATGIHTLTAKVFNREIFTGLLVLGNVCVPETIGFYKNHPAANIFPQTLGTYPVPDFTTAKAVYDAASSKNANNMLAAQLLAAKMNIANGVPSPSCLGTAIADGDAALTAGGYAGPSSPGTPSPNKAAVNAIKDKLDAYNNGCP